MTRIRGVFHHRFWIRLLHWEFWSFTAVNAWIMPYWGWLALKSRSFFFFNAANPAIENGGLLNESKKDIHQILPPGSFPTSLHFSTPAHPDAVHLAMERAGLDFPVMGKPDVGGRGRGVRKLENSADLSRYVEQATLDFHIQALIPYEQEVGIFYYKLPGETKGHVTGIVRKEFLTVVGDGIHTVRSLLKADKRGIMYLGKLEKILGDALAQVPEAGEKRLVSPYGNHARGSMFVDDSHLADDKLLTLMDSIANQIPGFHFGRLDIKLRNWADFIEGKDYSIIELNGAGAEPTHMYDPRHSLFFAWKEITRHWRIMQKVSAMNHARGVPYLSWKEGKAMFNKDKKLSAQLAQMPE
jgi:hypothetical protein